MTPPRSDADRVHTDATRRHADANRVHEDLEIDRANAPTREYHASPCPELGKWRDNYVTHRTLVWVFILFCGGAFALLWRRSDVFDRGAVDRTVAIAEIRKDIAAILANQAELKTMMLRHLDDRPLGSNGCTPPNPFGDTN